MLGGHNGSMKTPAQPVAAKIVAEMPSLSLALDQHRPGRTETERNLRQTGPTRASAR
jgi:hypothetical protein